MNGYGLTVTTCDVVRPPKDAVSVTFFEAFTALVVKLSLLLVSRNGMVTVAGTGRTVESELVRVTFAPPVAAESSSARSNFTGSDDPPTIVDANDVAQGFARRAT